MPPGKAAPLWRHHLAALRYTVVVILLTPGPCMTSDGVRAAAALPDLNHRDPAYTDVIHHVRKRLMGVYPGLDRTKWSPYLIGGSGTAAVEAMVTSTVKKGPVLVLVNGYYSGRIREILDVHGIETEVLSVPWTDEIPPEAVEKELRRRRYEAVLMTHHETTLGRLNAVSEIARIARNLDVRCLVDAMSSFGADDFDFVNVDAVAASMNKCLHGLPGVAFVLLNSELSAVAQDIPKRTYYLNLAMYAGENPPLTPPVPMLRSADQALRENTGGQPKRKEDYRAKRAVLEAGLKARGFRLAVPAEQCSLSLLSPSLPGGWSYDAWFEANYREGFVLYGTKGEYRERYFQISTMGETTIDHLEAWLQVVDRLIAR